MAHRINPPRLHPCFFACHRKLQINLLALFLLLFTIPFSLTAWSQGSVAESPAREFIKAWRPGVYDTFGTMNPVLNSIVKRTTKDTVNNPPWWNNAQGYYFDTDQDDFTDILLDLSPGKCTSAAFDNLPNIAGILAWHTHGARTISGLPVMIAVRFDRGNWLSGLQIWEGQNMAIWWIAGRSGMMIIPEDVYMTDGTIRPAYSVIVLPAYFYNNWKSNLDENKSILFGLSCYSGYPAFGTTLIDDVGGRVKFGYEELVTSFVVGQQLDVLLNRMNGTNPSSGALREANAAYNFGNFPWYYPPSTSNKLVMRPSQAPLTTLCPFVLPLIYTDYHWTDSTRTKWRVTHIWNLNTKSTKTGDIFAPYLPTQYKATRISETMVSDHELHVVWEMDGNAIGPWATHDWRNLKASSGGNQKADYGSAPNGDFNYSPAFYFPPGTPPP